MKLVSCLGSRYFTSKTAFRSTRSTSAIVLLWARPEYSKQRRADDPDLVRRNLEFTRESMRRQREQSMFDKSKSIITQVIGNKGTYCYLSRGGKWLLARLTKASPFTQRGSLVHNRGQFRRIENHQARLPAGRLYDLSGALK